MLFCAVCQKVVRFLDDVVKTNQTEAAIVSALDRVCHEIPSELEGLCDSLVDTYGVYLIELLVQYADPYRVCAIIKLC